LSEALSKYDRSTLAMNKQFVIPLTIIALLLSSTLLAKKSFSAELHVQLEQAMNKVRAAIEIGNYSDYKASLDPTKQEEQMDEEQFNNMAINSESKEILYRLVPDLTNEALLIYLIEKGDWAIYYAETNLEDDNYLTVSAFVFHKINSNWYYAGISSGLIKARPNSEYAKQGRSAWQGMDHIMDTIFTNPSFQLENLIKKRELIDQKE